MDEDCDEHSKEKKKKTKTVEVPHQVEFLGGRIKSENQGARQVRMEKIKLSDDFSSRDAQMLMDAVGKSTLTGKYRLHHTAHPDFAIVDLWKRDCVRGTPEQLGKDWYLFKARPLRQRTWVYHTFFRNRVSPPPDKDVAIEHRLLKYVFQQRCTDLDVFTGGWSSVMVYVFICAFASLTSDILFMAASHATLFGIYMVSDKLGQHAVGGYRWIRLVTLPFRCMYLGVVFWRMAGLSGFGTMGMLGILFAMILDFGAGDFASFVAYRYGCSYEIMGTLPNRVFVLRKIDGGDVNPESSEYHDEWDRERRLALMGSLQPEMRIIADVQGILCDLEPATIVDFYVISLEHDKCDAHPKDSDDPEPKRHLFLGLDVFNSQLSTFRAHREQQQRDEDMAERNAKYIAEREAKKKAAAAESNKRERAGHKARYKRDPRIA